MKKNNPQLAIANKIKKMIQTIKEVEKTRFCISITRLTSIKSLCADEVAAQKFALFIAQGVQKQRNQATRPEHFTNEEWEQQKELVDETISLMESYIENPTDEIKESLRMLSKAIDGLQGDDYRHFRWTTVHFVRSGDLLKLQNGLRCFLKADFPYWAYKLAAEYVERYTPESGTGIIHESVPMLLEIAEFWCQYYFDQSLSEKFPE